jgi:hypothetical protein
MIVWNNNTKKVADQEQKARRDAAAMAVMGPELCEGNIKLEITPFESFSQIYKYKKYLATIKDLRIVEENWSEEEGFNILVSVRVPLALGLLLEDMPEVAHIQLNGKSGNKDHKNGLKKMVVVMKTPEEAREPVLV